MKKIFAVMLALCMVFSMSAMVMAADAPFTDVEEDAWYAEEVAYVYENEIMFGVGDKLFAPENAVTRAMVWATLARVEDADKDSDPWWLEAQKWAMENKISDGT
ncbi:MAG: S-layer homology domain-containing protein, partial [Firmicutes bacterium]|nr:S-layer homology domain-containing protein [Bacillota bacterium]